MDRNDLFTAKVLFEKYQERCENLELTSIGIGYFARYKALKAIKFHGSINWLIYEQSFLNFLNYLETEKNECKNIY